MYVSWCEESVQNNSCTAPSISARTRCAQVVELEGFATRYVGQALGGGQHWRGKLSAETDSRGQKVYRATRKVVVPPGLAFYSVYRSAALLSSPRRIQWEGPKLVVQQPHARLLQAEMAC